jgi:hypothetical protein
MLLAVIFAVWREVFCKKYNIPITQHVVSCCLDEWRQKGGVA